MRTGEFILFSLILIIFICIGMIFSYYPQNDCIFECFISDNSEIQNTDSSYNKQELSEKSLININTDSSEELSSLPGIGVKLSQRIINFRKKNGNFEVIEDIMKVSGIGEKKFNEIKNHITVNDIRKEWTGWKYWS